MTLALLFLAAVALAGKPMVLRPSPGATVVTLPRTSAGLAEIGVYGNRELLAREVATWSAPGLLRATVADVAGGISFVELELESADLAVNLRKDGTSWRVSLVRRPIPRRDPTPILTPAELIAGVPRRPAIAPPHKLHPLAGDATGFGLDPKQISLPLPPGHNEPETATWDDIERWRTELGGKRSAELLDQLARAHRALGFAREAMAYYGWLEEFDAGPDPHLGRADSALAVGKWEVARAECSEAVALGAPDAITLPCLGVLSLATSEPPPAETARALLRVAERPIDRLVAGVLLLRDGYADEAVATLAALPDLVPAKDRPIAQVALGDAQFAAHAPTDARTAYAQAASASLHDLLAVRRIMVAMEVDGARRWPAWVPDLTMLSDKSGLVGSEALYLLAQIHAQFGDDASEATTLADLWAHDRRMGATDVPARLLAACGRRVTFLAAAGDRDAEVVALWGVCWRDELSPWLVDSEPLTQVSMAWERLGFLERARDVEIALVEALARREREDPAVYVRLARLQRITGDPDEAVDTVAYTAHLNPPKEIATALDLELGRALRTLERWEEAEAAFVRVGAGLDAAAIAFDRGRCADAVARAAPFLAAGPPPDLPGGFLELRSATCRASLDDPAGAIADAGLALARAADDPVRDEARWLASAIASRTGIALPPELVSAADPWVGIRTEDERHAAFLAALATWKHPVDAPPAPAPDPAPAPAPAPPPAAP